MEQNSSKFLKIFIFTIVIVTVLSVILYFVKSGDFISKATKTSNWKTYRNNTFGFESKYPNSYLEFHKSADSDIDFRTTKECEVLSNTANTVFPINCHIYTISVQKNRPNITASDYTTSTVFATSTIIVAGVQGEKVISLTGLGNWKNMDQVLVWFKKGDKWYIQTFTFNHAKSQEAESVMDQIISSFKFVN